MLTLAQVEDIAHDITPVGDAFLDGMFDLDPTAVYYRFLFRLVRSIKPTSVVELGVCTGRSSAHMAAGWPNATLAGIDPSPLDISPILARYPSIRWFKETSTSTTILKDVPDRSVDLCFFDTRHDYDLVSLETRVWLPKMKPGAVMLFDDISLNEGMRAFWTELALPKVSLPWLHWSGFGVALAPSAQL